MTLLLFLWDGLVFYTHNSQVTQNGVKTKTPQVEKIGQKTMDRFIWQDGRAMLTPISNPTEQKTYFRRSNIA